MTSTAPLTQHSGTISIKNSPIGHAVGIFLCVFLFVFAAPLPQAIFAADRTPPMPPVLPRSMRDTPVSRDTLTNTAPVTENGSATMNGQRLTVREQVRPDVGFGITDGQGGMIYVPAPAQPPSAGYSDARELRLKVRELADQLIAGMGPAAKGAVALPVSFVNQEDFTQSSALGRFMAEQLMYEFNQRGFPVHEYRMNNSIHSKELEGEFVLSRSQGPVSIRKAGTVVVAGTYYSDRQAIFINARLIRGTDGHVLRSAQLAFAQSPLTRRMLAGTGKKVAKGSIGIQDFKSTIQPTNLTPIDMGEDIH